jgi:hypothetical protein
MAGNSDNTDDGTARHDAGPSEVVAEIRQLHARLEEVHRIVAQRLATDGMTAQAWLHGHPVPLPAWRRRTQGELRWPVTLTVAVGIALQLPVPGVLHLISPGWVMPAVQAAMLIAIVAANPRRVDSESRALRGLSLTLAAVLSLANGYSVVRLAIGITQGTMAIAAGQLLITGGAIWLTNIVVFCLWYWEFDRGGPVARALNAGNRYPDFQFAQMALPRELVPPDWEPAFVDYLYLAFTNAAAFSPTDVMPLSRWAKVAMGFQAIVSVITVVLVVSRAVNILPLAPTAQH